MNRLIPMLVLIGLILGCEKPKVDTYEELNNIKLELSIDKVNKLPSITGKTINHPVLDSLIPITFTKDGDIISQQINFSSIDGFSFELEDGEYAVNSSTDFNIPVTTHLPFTIDDTITVSGDGEYEVEATSAYATISINDTENIASGIIINGNKFTQETLYVVSGERYEIRIPYSLTINGTTLNGSADVVIPTANANTNYIYAIDYIVHAAVVDDSSISISLILTDTFNDVTETIQVEHIEDECDFADGVTAETSIEPVLITVFDTNGGNGIAIFSNGLNNDPIWYRNVVGYPDPSWDQAYQNYTPGDFAIDPFFTHSQAPEPDYQFVDNAGAWSDDVELSFSWDNNEYIGCIGGVDNFTVEWIVGDTRYNDYRVVQSPNLELGVHFIYAIVTHQGETLVLSHFIEKTDGTTGKNGIRTGKVKRPVRQ